MSANMNLMRLFDETFRIAQRISVQIADSQVAKSNKEVAVYNAEGILFTSFRCRRLSLEKLVSSLFL